MAGTSLRWTNTGNRWRGVVGSGQHRPPGLSLSIATLPRTATHAGPPGVGLRVPTRVAVSTRESRAPRNPSTAAPALLGSHSPAANARRRDEPGAAFGSACSAALRSTVFSGADILPRNRRRMTQDDGLPRRRQWRCCIGRQRVPGHGCGFTHSGGPGRAMTRLSEAAERRTVEQSSEVAANVPRETDGQHGFFAATASTDPRTVTVAEFLAELRPWVERVVDQEGRPYGRTAADCPWIEHYFDRYRRASVAEFSRLARGWVGPHDSAESLHNAILDRVRTSSRSWFRSGQQPRYDRVDLHARWVTGRRTLGGCRRVRVPHRWRAGLGCEQCPSGTGSAWRVFRRQPHAWRGRDRHSRACALCTDPVRVRDSGRPWHPTSGRRPHREPQLPAPREWK